MIEPLPIVTPGSIQITGIEKDDKEQLISELPDGVTTVIHRGVNSLIACGLVSVLLKRELETVFLSYF